jgi:hypothetical protein
MTLDLKELNRLLDEIGPTIQKANQTELGGPDTSVHKSDDDIAQPYGRPYDFMSKGDSIFLQRRLNSLSWHEKGYLFQRKLEAGVGQGVPMADWQRQAATQDPRATEFVQKALDTSGGAALIRQDLSPFLTSIF